MGARLLRIECASYQLNGMQNVKNWRKKAWWQIWRLAEWLDRKMESPKRVKAEKLEAQVNETCTTTCMTHYPGLGSRKEKVGWSWLFRNQLTKLEKELTETMRGAFGAAVLSKSGHRVVMRENRVTACTAWFVIRLGLGNRQSLLEFLQTGTRNCQSFSRQLRMISKQLHRGHIWQHVNGLDLA